MPFLAQMLVLDAVLVQAFGQNACAAFLGADYVCVDVAACRALRGDPVGAGYACVAPGGVEICGGGGGGAGAGCGEAFGEGGGSEMGYVEMRVYVEAGYYGD